MSALLLDTHSVVWFLQDAPELSRAARSAVLDAMGRGETLAISAISVVEIIYLVEKRRMPESVPSTLRAWLDRPDAGLVVEPITQDVAWALAEIPRNAVPDMPDRIIGATARVRGIPLVTRDRQIRALTSIQTIW